jgi:hypothetical protein
MRFRTAVSICFLLLCSAFILVNAENATLPNGFVVVDSKGTLLGPVIGVMQGTGVTIVAIPTPGRWLPVTVDRSVFQLGSLEYTSFDCTGQAYASANQSPFPISSVVPTQEGNVLFGEDGPDQMVDVNSVFDPSSDMCFQESYHDPDAVPMAAVLNLNVFVPPFKAVRR